MSEKKVVRRTDTLALGVICILLIAGLGGTMAYYTMTINNKDSAYNDYVSTHSHTDSDYNSLNSTYYNYMGNHHYNDSEYNSLNSSYANLQATTDQLQIWLDGNKTLLNQTQTWLYSNITYYNSQIMNLTNENNQLQTWLNGNITSLEAQISTLNATITQMEEWLARGPPADHLAVANTVQAWYPPNTNLTKQFLFNCIDQDGTESNWAWLWVNGSTSDAAAFMSIIINPAYTSIEFCRCDAVGGDTLSVSIGGTIYTNIFSNSSWGLIGYWNIVK
jgi:hypothetical protein